MCNITSNERPLFKDHDYVSQIIEYARPVAVSVQEIREASENDDEILRLKDGIENNN